MADGGEEHAAQDKPCMVETACQLEVRVGKHSEAVQVLVTIDAIVWLLHVAVLAKDGRRLVADTLSENVNGCRVTAVVICDRHDGEGQASLERETFGNPCARNPVAVEDGSEVRDNGLHVIGTVSIDGNGTVESGKGFVGRGPAIIVHGIGCGGGGQYQGESDA